MSEYTHTHTHTDGPDHFHDVQRLSPTDSHVENAKQASQFQGRFLSKNPHYMNTRNLTAGNCSFAEKTGGNVEAI